MNNHPLRNFVSLLFFYSSFALSGQSLKEEKMQQLGFMVGDWIGTSVSFEEGKIVSEIPAYEKISYDLDQHILVVQLHSASLQLHTIIYFDEEDNTYYYYPFSKRGVRRLPASFEDGKLIVRSGPDTRYIFHSPEERTFQEYGEKLVGGEWVKYFEDTFLNTE